MFPHASMARRVRIARALATGAMLAFCGIGSAQLTLPLQSPKEAAPAEATTSTAISDTAARLGEVRTTLARLEQPGAVGEGTPTGTPDTEIGDRMRLLRQLERSLAQRLYGQASYARVVQARRDA